ncbi:MAG: hypothetical protein IT364_06700 [Candidatus Hydrogenedentes bacterium]|nr:hypothetical protein [Candidatus Hydrogenedentota bacterium]
MHRTIFALLLLAILPAAFLGCGLDGKGLVWGTAVSGDGTPDFPDDGGNGGGDNGGGDDGGNDGGNGGGGGGGTTGGRFAGSWMASFGDDLPQGGGRREYALRLKITQDNNSLTGSGSMLRFYNTGSTAFDSEPFDVKISGTASGNDASLTLSSSGNFDNNPTVWLRMSGTRIVALYAERDSNLTLDRSAHFVMHKVAATSIEQTWATAFSDEYGAGGAFTSRDRTGVMTLDASNDELSGVGSYVEQRPGDVAEDFDFDVLQGYIDGSETYFTLGNFTPANGEVDWFGYHSGSLIVAAYGQFNASNNLARFGHATWYQADDPDPEDFERDWITSFSDTAGAGSLISDYVMVMDGLVVTGNSLSGSVLVLDQSDADPEFVTYTIEEGVVIGNELALSMARGGSRFSWNMRLANTVLVGSYQQFNGSDEFVSRGVAEWRFGSAGSLAGTYAASYFDSSTTSGTEDRASQLAILNLSSVTDDGTISGTGTVRLAGEQSRRQFSIDGSVSNNHIQLIWSGADLFGDTVWNLRKAGSYLYGTYTNYASNNTSIEFQGSATYLRASN